ncbi:MAG: formylglycine-generating enzyme family protein [Pseudomonadota bacterium]
MVPLFPARLLGLAALTLVCSVAGADMVPIEGGEYRPLYLSEKTPRIEVDSFLMDATPVSNREFQRFVEAHPEWQRDNIPSLFAEEGYLAHWGEDGPLEGQGDWPVVRVSWFAADAYCQSRGASLPAVAQWEYVARASTSRADGSEEPGYNQVILDWYARSAAKQSLAAVDSGEPNYWGLHNLHGLIWEWVSDFNNALVSGESRADGTLDQSLFCGAGASGSADPSDYAAFMRFAHRTSLEATFTLKSQGFRCVKPIDSGEVP